MIRVFVGTDSDIHQDAEKVLEYSIRKHTNSPVEITFMQPGWKTPPTGFSSHRYLIPKLCNYEGWHPDPTIEYKEHKCSEAVELFFQYLNEAQNANV